MDKSKHGASRKDQSVFVIYADKFLLSFLLNSTTPIKTEDRIRREVR
jgi:hypothetical protein